MRDEENPDYATMRMRLGVGLLPPLRGAWLRLDRYMEFDVKVTGLRVYRASDKGGIDDCMGVRVMALTVGAQHVKEVVHATARDLESASFAAVLGQGGRVELTLERTLSQVADDEEIEAVIHVLRRKR